MRATFYETVKRFFTVLYKSIIHHIIKDVPKNHAFYKAILWGAQNGITKGYSDGTFGINRNVTRGACMMFLWRLKGQPKPTTVWKSPFKDVPKDTCLL